MHLSALPACYNCEYAAVNVGHLGRTGGSSKLGWRMLRLSLFIK